MSEFTLPPSLLSSGFGPCRTCQETPATFLVLLGKEAPIPGTGWGCVECELPTDGAMTALCDGCMSKPLKYACLGIPGDGKRIAISELTQPFGHKLRVNSQIFTLKPHLSN